MAEHLATEEAFFKRWNSGAETFEIRTSGSTGEPKTIHLTKPAMISSAKATGKAIGVLKSDTIHCCLPLDKVGGIMQLVRGLIWEIPVTVEKPEANPLLSGVKGSIISLTPMQLAEILKHSESTASLNQYRIVLIGGSEISAEIESNLSRLKPVFYHTYGMTETCSHIALRQIGTDKIFVPLPGIEVKTSDTNCLMIKGAVTHNEWLTTNDIVEISVNGFIVKGRADNVINSGGIKIQPEEVEAFIRGALGHPHQQFFLTSAPDSVLGEKTVLCAVEGLQLPDLNSLKWPAKYWKPREVVFTPNLPFTETGKPDREALRGLAAVLLREAGKTGDKP